MNRPLVIEQLEPRRLLSGLTLTISGTETVRLDGEVVTAAEFSYPSEVGPVNVVVKSIPDATPDYVINEDAVLVVSAAEGVSGGLLGVELVAGPTHGIMMLDDDGSFILAPDANWFGTDYFLHSRGGETFLTTVLVVGVNDAPTAVDDSVDGVEDTLRDIDVLANDSDLDGDPLSIDSFTQPENGVVTHDGNGIFTYTPDPDYNGTDSFTYVVSDDQGGTAGASVTIDVSPVNDRPTSKDDTFTIRVDEALTVQTAIGLLVNDTDVDGDLIAGTTVTSEPGHGVVMVTDTGAFLYIPDAEYAGQDSFQYKASDGVLWSEPATVTITIVDSNLPIVRSEVYLSGPDGITVDATMGVLANDMPGDGPGVELVATLVTGPSFGLMVLAADGSFTYVPEADYLGADAFTYKATDPAGLFGEVRSAFWVQTLPTAATSAGKNTELSKGLPGNGGAGSSLSRGGVDGPSLEDVYFHSETRKSNWDPVLSPEYVDRYYGTVN